MGLSLNVDVYCQPDFVQTNEARINDHKRTLQTNFTLLICGNTTANHSGAMRFTLMKRNKIE